MDAQPCEWTVALVPLFVLGESGNSDSRMSPFSFGRISPLCTIDKLRFSLYRRVFYLPRKNGVRRGIPEEPVLFF